MRPLGECCDQEDGLATETPENKYKMRAALIQQIALCQSARYKQA